MNDMERKSGAGGRSIVWVARTVEDFTRSKDEGGEMSEKPSGWRRTDGGTMD
jgi:hypothetical protein